VQLTRLAAFHAVIMVGHSSEAYHLLLDNHTPWNELTKISDGSPSKPFRGNKLLDLPTGAMVDVSRYRQLPFAACDR
jgi:hypothetical protein